MASNLVTYQNALVTAIKALGLSNIQSTEIVARRRPYDESGVFRGMSVCPMQPEEARGTVSREDIGYGFSISAYVGNDHSSIENIDKAAAWFEAIRKKIINRRLTVTLASGDTNLITQLTNGELYVPKEQFRYELHTQFVRCWARESRS